ncbi:methyltransferase domain-containing protein [Candidatus Hydrogenedentota bacterium]
MSDFNYTGSELDLFAEAANWKSYWSAQCQEYVTGDVLEVGAGLGANTPLFCNQAHRSWTCLEPDPRLAGLIQTSVEKKSLPADIKIIVGALKTLGTKESFDSILYIDVLEHIENDEEELDLAAQFLRPNGKLVVLAPAHRWLSSDFDVSLGHFRRYDRKSLSGLGKNCLKIRLVRYLDSVGLFASLANRLFLRQSAPTSSQIKFWDNYMISCSRLIDPLTRYRFGKSILMVWERS